MRQWASGLGQSLRRAGKVWIVDTPEGPATVRFTERNPFGVADHWVKPAGGAEIYIPIRVVANGDGAEVLFTLFRQPGMSTAQFDADAEWVERDLAALQAVLEGRDQASASAFSRS
jgi:hypothetical protein